MNHHQKTNQLVSAQIAAQQAADAATRALAFIIADSVTGNVLGTSIQIQLDNLHANAAVLMDALKKIEELQC